MSANQATERPAPARGRWPLHPWSVSRQVAVHGLVGLAAVAKESAAAAERTQAQAQVAAIEADAAANGIAEAASGTDETAISNVSGLATQTSAGAEGVVAAARGLTATADILEGVLGRFRSPSSEAVPLGAGW